MNPKTHRNSLSFVSKALLACVLLLSNVVSFSQKRVPEKLFIDGIVSGYYQNTGNGVSKKNRQIKLEGVLEGATIIVFQDEKKVFSIKTKKRGIFQLALKTGELYQLEFSNEGYSTSNLLLDLKNVPQEMASEGLIFENLEVLLNSYDSDNKLHTVLPFGRIFYDIQSKSLKFEETNVKIKKGLFSKEKIENPAVSLIEKAILKNKDDFALQHNAKEKSSLKSGNSKLDKQNVSSTFKIKNEKIDQFSESEIQKRESELALAKEQIEKDKLNAKTAEDSILIKNKESMLVSSENELLAARKFIDSQKKVISKQRMVLVLMMGFLLLLLVFIYVIYKNHKQKKVTNKLLEQKNKKITDSINYASRIQQSILLSDEEIKKIVPDSFIYYQPRDIVSGDFYWFSEINEKIFIAAVDCTGHGVPGAFMSFIGHSLMNEIINERKITRPSEVLNKMHEGVVTLLRQDAGDMNSQDGMELSLCVYDKKTRMLEYSGAMNPAYIVRNNEIIILEPDEQSIGGIAIYGKEYENISFTDKKMLLLEKDILYLFSDGFVDQFGGEENLKFNIPRFKDLLLEIQGKEMSIQKSLLEEVILKWKGNHRQIDDMLVIGVKF